MTATIPGSALVVTSPVAEMSAMSVSLASNCVMRVTSWVEPSL